MKFPSYPISTLLLMPFICVSITGANPIASPFAHAQVINDVDSDCWYKQCTNGYLKATQDCAKDSNVDMSKIDETSPEWKSYRTCFCERGDPFLEEYVHVNYPSVMKYAICERTQGTNVMPYPYSS